MAMRKSLSSIYSTALGIGTGLGVVVPWLWPATILGLGILFFEMLYTELSFRSRFIRGFLWGLGLMGVSLSYYYEMLPLTWLGVTNVWIGVMLVVAIWLVTATIIALPIGVVTVIIGYIRTLPSIVALLLVPCIWVLGEIARSLFFSVVSYGHGSVIGADFTFGYVGYALSWSSGLIHSANMSGVYGQSFVLSAIAALIAFFAYKVTPQNRMRGYMLMLIPILSMAVIDSWFQSPVDVVLGTDRQEREGGTVVLINTDAPATFGGSSSVRFALRDDIAQKISAAMSTASGAPVVILPEGSRFMEAILMPQSEHEREAIRLLEDHGALLLDSVLAAQSTESSSLVYAYDVQAKRTLLASPKAYLLPFGEYVPGLITLVAPLFGGEDAIARLRAVRATLVAGDYAPDDRMVTWKGVTYGVLACAELFSPRIVASIGHADVLVVLSSQSWVQGDTRVLAHQMLAMAKTAVVMTGKPYMQATNGAHNVVITPR